jgi:hypothetical protein
MPAIAYQRISDFPVRTLIGKSGLERPRIQIDCYANGYLEAKRIGKAVRDALDGYRAPVTVGEEQIRIAAQIVADRDFYESDTRRHRYSLDAAVWAHESTPAA